MKQSSPQQEMAQFELNFHIPEIELKEEQDQTSTHSSLFWFQKAKETWRKGAVEAAMDLYIQGLMVDESHSPSYHNLGCWANYLNKVASSMKYLEMANRMNPTEFKTIYGIIIIALKMGNLDLAIDYINIAKDLKVEDDENLTNLIYFEALWYKLDQNFWKANEWYHTLASKLYMKEKALVVKYTVGLLLIPTLTDRDKVNEFVENLQDIMDLYTIEQDEWEVINNWYNFESNQWPEEKREEIIQYLKTRSFFHRFSVKQLKEILPYMRLKKYKTNDVLFTEEINVYVVIAGDVIMKKFENNTFPNKILALFK